MTKVFIETSNAIPVYARKGDAGIDICADKDVTLAPGEQAIIPTGIKVAIPEGYEIQIRPRSGISAKTKLRVANAPGTIDSGYRGEIGVIMENTSKDYIWNGNTIAPLIQTAETSLSVNGVNELGEKVPAGGYYNIKKGDRIAQMVLVKYETADFEQVASVAEIGEDRGGGFGSTGVV